MKLKRHRADLRWLETHLPHREVDAKGCVLCGVIKRQKHLILMVEEELGLDDWFECTLRRKRVLKDAEVKK